MSGFVFGHKFVQPSTRRIYNVGLIGLPKFVQHVVIGLYVLTICLAVGSCTKLIFLHTNDVHSRFEQTNNKGSSCAADRKVMSKPCFGGVARRFTKVQEIRKRYPDQVLLLDAGDQFLGTLWFNVYHGMATSHFMNRLKYDAMAAGNHEYDNGPAGFAPFIKNVTFPVLSCNIDASKEPALKGLIKPSTVITINGTKVGIIGYITKDTSFLARPGKVVFLDEVMSIQKVVEKLQKDGINIIVALGHSGFSVDQRIAREVNGVDLVIGGHTNTFLYTGKPPSTEKPVGPYPTVVKQASGREVLVVQDFSFAKYLGFLEVQFDNAGEISSYTGNPILLNESIAQDAGVLQEIRSWKVNITNATNIEIGKSLVELEGSPKQCRLYECNMGNLIADAMVYESLQPSQNAWSNVTISLINGGGIRTSLTTGSITIGDIKTVAPFESTVTIVTLKGIHLLEALEHAVALYSLDKTHGRFVQVSGLKVQYDLSNEPNSRVVSAKVKCAQCKVPRYVPLDKQKSYQVALPDFVAKGGDQFRMINDNKLNEYDTGVIYSDVVINYIKRSSPLHIGVEGRIVFVTKKNHKYTGESSQLIGSLNLLIFAIVCSLATSGKLMIF